NGDGELRRERREQRGLALAHCPASIRIDGEQPDDVVPDEQRNAEGRVDAGLARGVARVTETEVDVGVGHLDEWVPAPTGADADLEQPLGDARVRTGEPVPGRRGEAVARRAEVDRHPLDVESLR